MNDYTCSLEGRRYYFAYGSNTPGQMVHRAPTADYLGNGKLKGHRLVFKKFADVEEDKHSFVEGFVFTIDEEAERELDIYEGSPALYRKEEVEVEFWDRTIKALVYKMNGGYYEFPGTIYLQGIAIGYEYGHLPMKQLKKALNLTKKLIMKECMEDE